MAEPPRIPVPHAAGGRVPWTWRLLLRALPRPFRARYAADMTLAFLDRRGDARRRGRAGLARFWLREAVALCRTGLAERWRSSLDPARQVPAAPAAVRPFPRLLMHGFWQDVRFALRLLRRQPTFTTFVALTLVIGLGANVAVFSVVNGVLLKPLPFDEPEDLVAVWGRFLPESGFDFPEFPLSLPELVDYRRESRAMAAVAGFTTSTATITGHGGEPERVAGGLVTPDFFQVLRAAPALGRTFTAAEGRPGGPDVVLLGFGLWQSRFGGQDVLGRTVMVNGTAREVIGVMPASFDFPRGASVWSPLRIDPANPGGRQSHGWQAVGRLAEGATLEQAQAEMASMMDAWRAEWPDIHTGHFLYLTSLLDDTVGPARPALWSLQAATLLLLLIVSANVGSMLLARGEARVREMAIRTALGAARRRLVRLALIDSAVLATVGCAGGMAVAVAAVRWLRSLNGVGIPRLDEAGVDWTVAAFAVGSSVIAALLFGLPPAWRGASGRVQAVLRQDARTATDGRGRLRARAALVAAEVALAVVLVVGASLMIRSLASLGRVDPGFDPDGLLIANVALPAAAYADDAVVERFYVDALDRIRALPGVRAASAATTVPIVRGSGVWDFVIDGAAEPGPGQPAWNAAVGIATPGYFDTVGVSVIAGRAFDSGDRAGGAPVVVVNEAMVRRFFAGEDPIGGRIRVAGGNGDWMTVVGVVGDVRDQSLDVEPRPMYVFPHAQAPQVSGGPVRSMAFLVRAHGEPSLLAADVRAVVRSLDPALPLFGVQTYDEALATSMARRRFTSTLFVVFAAMGLLLGAIGVYGVLAFAVAERTPELGIRRALGAPAGRLMGLVLVQGMVPVAVGLVGGVGLAVAGSRYLESELFGVSATDPGTYLAVAAVVVMAALAACLVPVRRALRVDPGTALRAG